MKFYSEISRSGCNSEKKSPLEAKNWSKNENSRLVKLSLSMCSNEILLLMAPAPASADSIFKLTRNEPSD